MYGYLESASARCCGRRGLLQRHLPQFRELDGSPLTLREARHCLTEGLGVSISGCGYIRVLGGKGFRGPAGQYLVGGATNVATGAVRHAVSSNRHQPGEKRTARVVRAAGNV